MRTGTPCGCAYHEAASGRQMRQSVVAGKRKKGKGKSEEQGGVSHGKAKPRSGDII